MKGELITVGLDADQIKLLRAEIRSVPKTKQHPEEYKRIAQKYGATYLTVREANSLVQ